MEGRSHRSIKPELTDYLPVTKETVFRVSKDGVVDIKMGESLDIDIDCQDGFTVFIPYAGLFHPVDGSDQIFEASEIFPSDISGKVLRKLWRVTLTRKNQANPYANKKFAYCIYSPELDNFAVASSPPKMNLNP